MIKLENITIQYEQQLLDEAVMEIHPGKLTVIEGESGSGKTTLLYLIGLIKHSPSLQYSFNHQQIDLKNESLISNIRKNKIGYVFQENSLIPHLSIYDNFVLYNQMVGKQTDKVTVRKLLDEVALDMDVDQTTSTLSGGERQRLAIACALSKNPDLLILDEPTSALDEKNAMMIMRILRRLADSGKMIVLTSHDEDIVKLCDVQYKFENKKLVTHQPINEKSDMAFTLSKTKLKLSFYLSYFARYMKSKLFSFIVLFTVISFVITLMIGYQEIGKAFENEQLEALNDIANCEMLVTSKKDRYGEAVYRTDLPQISQIKIENIKNSKYCDAIYPFYQAYSTSVCYEGIDYEIYCTIQPYTAEKSLENIVQLIYDQKNEIYISHSLFQELEMDPESSLKLDVQYILPNGLEASLDAIQVAGVLPQNYQDYYSDNSYIIYVPYEQMPQLDNVHALLVYANHFNSIDQLKDVITDVDPEFGVFNRVFRVGYLEQVLDNVKKVTPFLMLILAIISVTLIIMIYVRYINNRRFEICLLKVNGMSKLEILKMMLIETLVQVMIISILSLIFLMMIYFAVSNWMNLDLSFQYSSSILKAIGLSVIYILPPSIVSIIIFQRQDPAVFLRN